MSDAGDVDELRWKIQRLEVDLDKAEDRIRSLELDIEWMRSKIWTLEDRTAERES